MKAHLITAPILRFPNFNKKFYIETDASTVGLGAMLSQTQGDDELNDRLPVAYASRSLSEAERNYGITDLEGLAVSWAISHFETYIHGMPFTIITDHSALKALKDKSLLTGRLLRRAEKLLEYDFDVIYRAGREHVVPDFLSRIYLAEMSVSEDEEKDRKLAVEKNKIYIPLQDRSCLLERSHRSYTGHLRTAKLFAFISQRFFWSGMYKDIKNVCDSCLTCARIHSTIDY